MVQVYSSNLDVPANAAYPLNNVVIQKGTTAVVIGASTIQLNQRGIYCIHCDGFATPATATLVSTQMYVNGLARSDANSGFTGVANAQGTFGFEAYVQVSENNTCCCCTAPTTIQFMNGETEVSEAHINIVVSKLC